MNEFVFKDGETVVFIGDSITDCGRRGAQAPYGSGYVKFIIDLITARYPERHITYFNEGIGGNTVEDLYNRWENDLLSHKDADWVSVKIGINDLHRFLGGASQLAPDKYEILYRRCLTMTKEKLDAKLILVDPFYVSTQSNSDDHQMKVLKLIPEYLQAVEKLAKEFDALHVYTHQVFQNQLKYRSPDYFCPEPVHPYPNGHMVIALAILEKLGW